MKAKSKEQQIAARVALEAKLGKREKSGLMWAAKVLLESKSEQQLREMASGRLCKQPAMYA